jgi:hypothetical protein
LNPIIVREYTSAADFERDAAQLAGEGYAVTNQSTIQPRSGCLRIILLGGIGALIWRPKPRIVVTYTLAPPREPT